MRGLMLQPIRHSRGRAAVLRRPSNEMTTWPLAFGAVRVPAPSPSRPRSPQLLEHRHLHPFRASTPGAAYPHLPLGVQTRLPSQCPPCRAPAPCSGRRQHRPAGPPPGQPASRGPRPRSRAGGARGATRPPRHQHLSPSPPRSLGQSPLPRLQPARLLPRRLPPRQQQ